jgi:hypothetical protein
VLSAVSCPWLIDALVRADQRRQYLSSGRSSHPISGIVMLNQNTAHAKHPTTTLLRALKQTARSTVVNCYSSSVQVWSGWTQQTSRAEVNLIIRESAPPEEQLFFAKNDCGPIKRNFLNYLPA